MRVIVAAVLLGWVVAGLVLALVVGSAVRIADRRAAVTWVVPTPDEADRGGQVPQQEPLVSS